MNTILMHFSKNIQECLPENTEKCWVNKIVIGNTWLFIEKSGVIFTPLLLYLSEILNTVEGGIVGVVKIVSFVHCGAAKINNIFTLNFKIHILKSNLH